MLQSLQDELYLLATWNKRRKMQRWRSLGGITVLVLIALFASARFVAYPVFVGNADTVHVTVTQIAPTATTTNFDQRFTQQAQRMLTQITSGVQTDTLQAACPASSNQLPYYHYDFVFAHMGHTIVTGSTDARECARIAMKYLDGSTTHYAWETSQNVALWDVYHQLGNVPRPIHMCTNATCS